MNRVRLAFLALLLGFSAPAFLRATDPPHDTATYGGKSGCLACHLTHRAPGGTLTSVSGNSNLCLTCHTTNGNAKNKPLFESNEALPTWGLPAGVTAAGSSHRWDSGPQGHITRIGGATPASTGKITPSGAYTGVFPTTIEIKIMSAGNVGTAQFQWRSTSVAGTWGGSSASLTTQSLPYPLTGTGVSVAFANGTGTSFQTGDVWHLYLRAGLRLPATPAMAIRLDSNGALMCSTCHDQHLQANAPYDPSSSPSYTEGVTNNRRFQRVANDTNGMCADCHAARNVVSGGGSHPVGVAVSGTNLQAPSAPLAVRTDNKVQCLTCHQLHDSATNDGSLLRVSYQTGGGNPLCTNCHLLADTSATPGAHFNTTATGALWPGDGYGGSAYPAITDATQRGACKNCHAPHGWPDAASPTSNYSKLLGARQDNLCTSCHDSNGPSNKDVLTEISKTVSRHPVDRTSGRMVGCADCHNPHMTKVGIHTATGTTPATTQGTADGNRIRNAAGTVIYSGALRGVDGVRPTTWPTFAAPASGVYQTIATGTPTVAASGAEFEWQICFKCHTSYSFGTTPPDGMTSGGTTSMTIVSGALQPWTTGGGTASFTSTTVTGSGTTWNTAGTGLKTAGMFIRRGTTGTGTGYRITAVNSNTSLTITGGATGSSSSYQTRVSASFAASTAVTVYGTNWTPPVAGQFIAPSANGATGTSYRITAVTPNGTPTTTTTLTIASNATATTFQNFYLHPGAGFTAGSSTVTGYGTNWTSALVGQGIQANGQAGTYLITQVNSATSLTLASAFGGTTGIYRYLTGTVPAPLKQTDLAAEFNPANRSVHPVVNSLNNQTGSVAPKALTSTLSSPWNANKGNQTMTCSDCHNTDGTGAQGPHGSAAQFMLKTFTGGQDPANWPDVALSSRATSWCNNCHSLASSNNVHSKGDHSSQPCYACHIVIPHGGAMSRLIADQNGTMPARYAYNNDKNNVQITSINKKAANSYQEGDCGARCDTGKHPLSTGENW